MVTLEIKKIIFAQVVLLSEPLDNLTRRPAQWGFLLHGNDTLTATLNILCPEQDGSTRVEDFSKMRLAILL